MVNILLPLKRACISFYVKFRMLCYEFFNHPTSLYIWFCDKDVSHISFIRNCDSQNKKGVDNYCYCCLLSPPISIQWKKNRWKGKISYLCTLAPSSPSLAIGISSNCCCEVSAVCACSLLLSWNAGVGTSSSWGSPLTEPIHDVTWFDIPENMISLS